jgi:hypothetical protein
VQYEEASIRHRLQEGAVLTSIRFPLLACLFLGTAGMLNAQSAQPAPLSPSPTLPSDTLEANYAPRSAAGPSPEVSPTLPSDTLEATQPVDSFPTDAPAPASAADSAALRDIQAWIENHPGLLAPPPVRALLVRA